MTSEYREWKRKCRAQKACGHEDWVRCKFCKQWGPPETMWVGVEGPYQLPIANHRECQAKYKQEQRKIPEVGERLREQDRERGSARPNRTDTINRYNASPKRTIVSQRYSSSEKGKLSLETNGVHRRARLFAAEGSHTPEEWRAMVAACNSRCARCGEIRKVTRDHIIPLTKGGSDYISN